MCRDLTAGNLDGRSTRAAGDTEAVEVSRGHITEGLNGQAKEVRCFLRSLGPWEDLQPKCGMMEGQVTGDGWLWLLS